MRLAPIEKPPSVLGKLLDLAVRRMLGRSLTPYQVIYNRVPAACDRLEAIARAERASA